MKILLIGGNGMLGTELKNLLSQTHEVTAWDKNEIDITQENDVMKKVVAAKPEIIINAAAYTAVDDCEVKQDLAMSVNGDAVGYLANAAAKLDIPLVHYSTDYVFEGTKPEGYKEDDQPNPQSIYAKSKYLGEQLLQKNAKKFYLIRSSWLYGQYGKNWVDTMLTLAKTRDALSIVNDQHGKPTYAKDLAERTKELIESGKEYGIYHITNEGAITWNDFGKEIFRIKNLPVKVSEISTYDYFKSKPYFAKRPEFSALINTKLSPSRPWQEALKEYLMTKEK